MSLFNTPQRQTLRAVCETLIPALDHAPDPSGLFARSAADLDVASAIETAIIEAVDPFNQLQIKLFLDGLNSGALNGLLDRVGKPFVAMTLTERETVLRGWSESALPLRRKAFQAVKRLAFFMFYALVDEAGQNPNWPAIGYSGPPPRAQGAAKPITPLVFTGETTLYTDVVIVGSGAGGGVVAGELSAAGLDVIVTEKGGYRAESDFDGLELSSNQHLFENKGLCATSDLGVLILAGSTLGGGTVMNWSVSLRTPDGVLGEWQDKHGLTGYAGADFQQSFESVMQRLHVNSDESAANAQNAILERGGRALGYAVETIPRNVKGCEACGFCNFGCSFGAKQSTLKTYLQDAFNRGARIAVKLDIARVLIEGGRAVGVVGMAAGADGQAVSVTIRAKRVVLAAGALNTPTILLRSGLSNPNIGRNLHLHPATVTYGMYPQTVCGWQGAPMTRIISQFGNLNETGYGFILETAPVHPGIGALSLPWHDGLQHKLTMSRLDHLSNILAIVRDEDGGRVTLDRKGRPVYHYELSKRDAAKIALAVEESLKIHQAAGALEVSSPHSPPITLSLNGASGSAGSLAPIYEQIARRGYHRNGFALFSAHQMSSARMGGNPAIGAFDPTGESFEVKGLYVADGSALPTAVGRNPMITIMAVAHWIAQGMKSRA